MKQIIQSLSSGATDLIDVPVPVPGAGQVLIRTTRTLVSLGTERMLVEFGRANFLDKARQQPDKVRQVVNKVKTDGLQPTLRAVRNKLDTPIPLGYCNVGVVHAVGGGVSAFNVGDRVASNGPHAEYALVGENLVAHVPEGVSDDEAAFTVVGAIGLQGIRMLAPTFGETVVVYGLGLIGLLTARLLLANGCRVIGIDIDAEKQRIAAADGVIAVSAVEDAQVVPTVLGLTGGFGADGVVITASAKVEAIIANAARMSRTRGRIVLVGVVPLNLSRDDFYKKELSFSVSCSYGPGRYDPAYENKGLDYPIGYVRWTEQRNFRAVLEAMDRGTLRTDDLITQRRPIGEYEAVYGDLGGGQIASLFEYERAAGEKLGRTVGSRPTYDANLANYGGHARGVAVVGAGNFTASTVLPALTKAGAPLVNIVSRGGLTAAVLARRFNIPQASTDLAETLADPSVGLVVVTTRHDLHAGMVVACLDAGKNVFVEKPMALTYAELEDVAAAQRRSGRTVTVGFNRRFSPHAVAIRDRLPVNGAKNMTATMNAGALPPELWVHDLDVGGGRIIGEACHYIDLLTYFSGSPVVAVCSASQGIHPKRNSDNVAILLRFANGDLGTVNYFANGAQAYPKERVEIHCQGATVVLDNFRETKWYGYSGAAKLGTSLDKGHGAQFAQLVERFAGGGAPLIPFGSLLNTSRAAIAAVESLAVDGWVAVEADW